MSSPPVLVLALLATLTLTPIAAAQTVSMSTPGAPAMTHHARGPFDVKMAPQDQDVGEGSTLGRMSLDKTFHGNLEATGRTAFLKLSYAWIP